MNYAHIKGPGDFTPPDEIDEFDEQELRDMAEEVISEWLSDKDQVSEYLTVLNTEDYEAIDSDCAAGDAEGILTAMREGMRLQMQHPALYEAMDRIRERRKIEREEMEIYNGSSDYD